MSKILYIAPIRDFSGYATAARGYINALHKAGGNLVVRPVRYDQTDPGSAYKITDIERELLRRDLNDVNVVIQHLTPNEMRPTSDKVNIAVVAWETTRIPAYWVNKLNQFHAVITFCDASIKAFRDCGVTVPVHKVPHTFDIPTYNLKDTKAIRVTSESNFLEDRFVFYNISQFSTKKGIDLLLRSYYGTFHNMGEQVALILKTYVSMGARDQEQKQLEQYVAQVKAGMRLIGGGYPPVIVITDILSEKQIKKLHATGDCYVCSSRGEGWCIPAFEALTYGNKLVTPLWGGMGEFAQNPRAGKIASEDNAGDIALVSAMRSNVYPVEYSMQPLVGQTHADPELYTAADLIAECSVSSLMASMKQAFDNREVSSPAPDMMEFDHSVVGPKMLQIIQEVAEATQIKEVINV